MALDYLGKYCILTPEQLRAYRIVFTNLDRDKDGLLSFTEIDFGLKTINRQLITEQQARYVYEVLEVDPALALDFRLFAV